MRCPFRGGLEVRVKRSRPGDTAVRRRTVCLDRGRRSTPLSAPDRVTAEVASPRPRV